MIIKTSILSALDRHYGSSYEKLTNQWLNAIMASRKSISKEIMGFFCIED